MANEIREYLESIQSGSGDPGAPGGGTLYMKVYLWRDSGTGEYRATMENMLNVDDPLSPRTLTARLTYGGAVAHPSFGAAQ